MRTDEASGGPTVGRTDQGSEVRRRTRFGDASSEKLGLWDATAMAVGGMIGGGIFSVLGEAIGFAGHLAVGCFVIGAVLAALTARAYAGLGERAGRAGGPFEYLREAGHPDLAAVTAWLLILGYVLALGVYGYTFGHYIANLAGWPSSGAHLASIAVLVGILLLNWRGIRLSTGVEDLIVAAKIAVLVGIAFIGLGHFTPDRLSPVADRGWGGLVLGASAIFVAYEGFELLSFDYDDLAEPRRDLRRAMYLSIVTAAFVYVSVTLGAQMLLGDAAIVAQREVAFAAVGAKALGAPGRWAAALGAALATCSAINATLFATARFARDVAASGELPERFSRTSRGQPMASLAVLSIAGAAFAMLPSLAVVLAFASCTFLAVFVAVNVLAAKTAISGSERAAALTGAVGCSAAMFVLLFDLARTAPASLAAILTLYAAIVVARGGPKLARSLTNHRPPVIARRQRRCARDG